jgi:YHS domain-containing protein
MISCRMANTPSAKGTFDIVCGTKVNCSESFIKVYNGSSYYFDSYACKQMFTHKPQKYIQHPGSGVKQKYHPAKF